MSDELDRSVETNLPVRIVNAIEGVPPTRRYRLDTLVVEWRKPLCIGCQLCHVGLPEVFEPDRRPWVDLTKATPGEIRQQVRMCPTGALFIGTLTQEEQDANRQS